MLDIKFIRKNVKLIQANAENKGVDIDVGKLLKLDEKRREHLVKLEQLRAKQNKLSKGRKGKPSKDEISKLKKLSEQIKLTKEGQDALEEGYKQLLWAVPNVVHEKTPIGKDESENKVLKKVGKPTKFAFKAKKHWELGADLDVIDIPRAARVSGARFAYLKGRLALLEFALINFALSVVTDEKILKKIAVKAKLKVDAKPFIPVIPPVLMRPEVMDKMARLEPKEERYHIEKDDLYLIGSAEHTLGPLHMNETLDEKDLPIRYIGFSTAFRREAGSYGKDTKGIFRVHQFDKLEFASFTAPEQGIAEQNFLIAIQEHLMQELKIPYQVVLKCTGDMAGPDYRELDIEAWMPGQGKYRETHTSDYMTDYQARRLNTKIKNGKYVHMNDATVMAMSRLPIAIMENYQQKDGSIKVPKVLQKYCGFESIE